MRRSSRASRLLVLLALSVVAVAAPERSDAQATDADEPSESSETSREGSEETSQPDDDEAGAADASANDPSNGTEKSESNRTESSQSKATNASSDRSGDAPFVLTNRDFTPELVGATSAGLLGMLVGGAILVQLQQANRQGSPLTAAYTGGAAGSALLAPVGAWIGGSATGDEGTILTPLLGSAAVVALTFGIGSVLPAFLFGTPIFCILGSAASFELFDDEYQTGSTADLEPTLRPAIAPTGRPPRTPVVGVSGRF